MRGIENEARFRIYVFHSADEHCCDHWNDAYSIVGMMMMQMSELIQILSVILGSDALYAAITTERRVPQARPPNQLGIHQSAERSEGTKTPPTRAYLCDVEEG
jgi:hypothetical protein